MENHFEGMTYMRDRGAMCGDLKFLNNTEINDCRCPDIVKRSCLALRDMFKSNNPNKGYMIVKFIEITKEHIKESLSK